MRKMLIGAVAAGLLVGSAGGALAWQYSGNVYASVAGHGAGAHAVIASDYNPGYCAWRTEVWATSGGSWYFGAEANLYRASDNALISDGAMDYNGPVTSLKTVITTYNPPGVTNYYSLGKFAIYNGNSYNYWWTNRSPYAGC